MDAPFHFIPTGDTVENLPLEALVGPCKVIQLPGMDRISADALQHACVDFTPDRLLIKTDNSALWSEKPSVFDPNFIALEPDAAQWIAYRNIQLVGIDYLSIGRFRGGEETHRVLLDAGIVVIEGLNLNKVDPGTYELICLPLKIAGAEGAPVRAILRR